MILNLSKYNRHWLSGFKYQYPIHRDLYLQLKDCLGKRSIIELTGLRRTGKSTLLFQLINSLLSKSISQFQILYFTFDEIQPSLDVLFENYYHQTNIDYRNKKIWVFLDEIQKLSNFQNQIKVYYDLYPDIKFIITGSTSLFIRKKTQESLAGRIQSFHLLPLSFREYLLFRNLIELINKPLVFEQKLRSEFSIFLKSQFIESIKMNPDERKEYYKSIINKIIFEDLPNVYKIDYPQIIYKMALFVAQKPGGIINNIHLAQEFGISNKTIAQYFTYFEDLFLVKKYYNFSRNIITSERSLKKYYLASPSFSAALADFIDESVLFENYIASLSNAQYFYRDPFGREVDFVLAKDNKTTIPVEAKYKTRLTANDVKNILYFMNKYNITGGYIITGLIEKTLQKIKGKRIYTIPFYENYHF